MAEPPYGAIPRGVDSALYQTWQMLLNGYGFNWYRAENLMRADDLLIRSRASEHLGNAAMKLREIEAAYRRKYLPPPTREKPDADPAVLAEIRRLREIEERILGLDTKLRGSAVPPNDKIWERYRGETGTLERLIGCDVVVVGTTREIETTAAAEAGPTISEAGAAKIDRYLQDLSAALARRGSALSFD